MAQNLNALINDTLSPSSELLRKMVDWALDALNAGQKSDKILNDISYLCRSHPSKVLLQSFHRFFLQIPLNANKIKSWFEMYLKHESSACQHFANHLANFKNILVYSSSGLLEYSLRAVSSPLNIFCTEGRPAMEGRMLAEKLARSRHKIYLISDMAAFSVIPRIEILALGCDAITTRGVINKIGTAALASAAQQAGKKAYFIGTSEKIADKWSEEFLLREGPKTEIYSGTEAVQVENYYFDITSSNLIDGIFLEGGLATRVLSL
ncbi:MAG: hypothetical protein C5B54_03310 [Acidobacteria bacterium]|nr:MAG: hypothetical protein C5B54_03310 [Acidobacteriota bacterium]